MIYQFPLFSVGHCIIMLKMLVLLTLILLLLGHTNSQNCETRETCDECIQEVGCDWCAYPLNVIENSSPHCRPQNASVNWCNEEMKMSPKMSLRIIQDRDFSEQSDGPVQIKPQRIALSLRKGDKFDLNFRYKSTENYPIDLYYLTDLSNSMQKFTRQLGDLGYELAKTMKTLTSKFQLGYGSFIDKGALPYATMKNFKMKPACIGCVISYSFKNHLSLSNDYDAFVKAVKSSKYSGNVDTPEGGFDALMQAIVCKEKLGWREKARHLIVFSTDAKFHVAGDGKLAGILEPNKGICYDDENDFTVYDYPSVSQLNHVSKENNINIIFAIISNTTSITEVYKKLSDNIENSKYGALNTKRNDVVNLVLENYKKIVQTVKFTSNATKAVDVKFSSHCNNPLPDRCNNVHVGETLEFTATIEPRECLPKGQKAYISIKPEALNEDLVIELDVNCECTCSSKDYKDYEPKSPKCSDVGDLQCGVCVCPKGHFGRQCECGSDFDTAGNFTNCIMEGSSEICSGLGECKCGKCECSPNPNGKIYGQFCQCNNYSCRKEKGVQCSGKGKCNCNVCECEAGYSGEACECQESKHSCIMADSDQLCSGNGDCECGRCKCFEGYSGRYCEECTTCPDGHKDRCNGYRLCVECQAFNSGFYKDNCEENCGYFDVKMVEKLEENKHNQSEICHLSDQKSCMMHFSYFHKNNTIFVEVMRECVSVNFLGWILGVPLGTLLLGLLSLIIWKVFVSIHDRKEYAKFEKERLAMKWHRDDNPLYKEATSTFANPAYNRSSINSK